MGVYELKGQIHKVIGCVVEVEIFFEFLNENNEDSAVIYVDASKLLARGISLTVGTQLGVLMRMAVTGEYSYYFKKADENNDAELSAEEEAKIDTNILDYV